MTMVTGPMTFFAAMYARPYLSVSDLASAASLAPADCFASD